MNSSIVLLLLLPTLGLGIPVPTNSSEQGDPCYVSGIRYLHSQQIGRDDPCELCMCLDGEVFCWWQQQCLNATPQAHENNTVATESPGTWSTGEWEVVNSTTSTQPPAPTSCTVMGVEYKVGEVLPRETGTCLQCQCAPKGRVTCSPKDCSPQGFRDLSLDMFDVDVF